SQQDPNPNYRPGLSRLGKDNGDPIPELKPEAAPENRSANLYRWASRRLPLSGQRALVDSHKPDKQPRPVDPSLSVLSSDRRDRNTRNHSSRVHTRRAHPRPAHPTLSRPSLNLASPNPLLASPSHLA